MGFCFFNNVAVAARHALDALGVERVFVLDWDVHHGNGTNDVFHSSREVLFASIHQYPWYPGTGPLTDVGEGDGEGFSINLPVPSGSGEDVWLSLVEHVVMPAAREFEPQLVLISAGFDAHRDDPLGMCRLESSSFAAMALWMRSLADSLGVPVGGVLEGGYDLRALSASCAAALEALRDGGEPGTVEPHPLAQQAARVVGQHWPLPIAGATS
jgi:acetoin utilization deacetylase AcuC-like enzyme